jgi:hypothetical protein
MAIGVLVVRRPRGQCEHRQRHDRSDQVNQRFERVGQQAD